MKKISAPIGSSIKMITEKIKAQGIDRKSRKNDRDVKSNLFQSGKLSISDLKYLGTGLAVLERIISEGFNITERKFLAGEEDVSKAQKAIVSYRGVMEDFIRRLSRGVRQEYDFRKSIECLREDYRTAQAARDGIIVKQEKRTEIRDGKEKEIIYDTSMTPREVLNILKNYERQADRVKFNKLNNYLGLGLGLAGILGSLTNTNQKDNEQNEGNISLVSIGTMAVGGLKLLRGVMNREDRKEQWVLGDNKNRMIEDFLDNEQISSGAEINSIENIQNLSGQEKYLENKMANRQLALDIILDLTVALISGMYINKKVQTKENGKIDGKSLASALISLQSTKRVTGNLINTIQDMLDSKKEEEDFEEIYQKVREILKQMEEKVYPLEGAKHSFDSIKITEFVGKFYPKKDYETDQINYSTTIKISEFSMQRGDVVLLSGESGTGKSTFLRFLKRGDINNRKAIQLDNEEMVDNLGNEYLSFRPSINLGDETNVLYQITGKSNISDLTKEEQKKLVDILSELKFNSLDLLERLASKKFMEFSTGQQRRLALSKVFYRIDDGTSVIIVDEPVGNVEDSLIREQLEMIKKYAKTRNVMLILTTHRLDLAEDLATKRYNINKNGVLEQIPVKKEDKLISDKIEIGE